MKKPNVTPLEMEQYLLSLKSQMDRENFRAYHRKKGRKKARKKGRKEERLKIAKNFKDNGAPLEMISQSTGLTMEQIQRL